MIIKENSIFKYYIKLTYKSIIFAIIVLLSLSAIEVIQPLMGEKIVNLLNVKNVGNNFASSFLDVIIVYMLLDIGISFLLYTKNIMLETINKNVTRRLRVDILETIVNFKYQKTAKFDSGYLYARVGDGEKVAMLFSRVIPTLISNIIYLFAIIFIMTKVSAMFALIMVAAMFVIALVITGFFWLGRKYLGRGNKFKDAKNLHYIQTINGIKQIKTHRIGKIFLNKLAKLNKGEYSNYMKKEVINTSVDSLLTLGENAALALLIIIGIKNYSNLNINIGQLYLCITYIRKMFVPIYTVIEELDNAQRGVSSYLRICKFMNQDKEFNKYVHHPRLEKEIENITFKNVGFAYNENNNLFSNISFEINKHERVAITGDNGIGKRTLINLLLKLYKTKSGKILVNGENINKISASSIRERITFIEQEPDIFKGSLEENITLLDLEPDRKRLHEVIEETKLDYLLNRSIEENGKNLTYGQKQMIALARAMYKNGDIFVWDEPSSTLDFETEKILNVCIKKLVKNKTFIIIAHRISTIKKCPKIINITHEGVYEYAGFDNLIKKPN